MIRIIIATLYLFSYCNYSMGQTKTKNVNTAPNYGTQHIGDTYINYKKHLSKHDQFIEDFYIKGLLIPDALTSKYKYMYFKMGSVILGEPIRNLTHLPRLITCMSDDPIVNIALHLKDNHLYISTTLKYVQNGEVMAKLDNNKWMLYKNNILDFSADEKHFEIIDKSGNVALSMELFAPNVICIRGYFIHDNKATAINDSSVTCTFQDSLGWKNDIINTVKSIKPYDSTLIRDNQ